MVSEGASTFWKGDDFSTAKRELILNPGFNPAPIIVEPRNLPQLNHPDELRLYRASMRSRYAQLGLDIDESFGNISQAVRSRTDTSQLVESSVIIVNHTPRLIRLPESARLFRLFRNLCEPLKGFQLHKALREGEIHVDGKQGVDWELEYTTDYETGQKDIGGLRVAIGPHRTWIPDKRTKKTLSISDSTRNFRQEIDTHHVPIPTGRKQILWVGETPKITLNNSIEGILDHIAFPNIGGEVVWSQVGTHIKSHLIDAGSDWPIRVEILSSTTPETMPNFVVFYFYRNGQEVRN